jgi:hypothetical protein
MAENNAQPDERLQKVLAHALAQLLEAAGFPGGILVAVTPTGQALLVSVFDEGLPINPAELLRMALGRLEAGAARVSAPPMNG